MRNTVTGFKVIPGEQVTITVFPSSSLGDNYSAVRDANVALDAYNWTVTKAVGQRHVVLMHFDFLGAGVGPGSFYRIQFRGTADNQSGPFNRYVYFESPDKDPAYVFPVENQH